MEERKMTIKEANRLHIIKLVKSKKINIKRASKDMNICYRQAKRIWRRYKREGDVGIISKKRKDFPKNKIPETKRKKIGQILYKKYIDFGPTFACEKLRENENIYISRETLRKLMISESLWIPKKKRALKIYQRRTRRSRFGELIQIDGSYHKWFENRADKCCLLVFIDDATSKIVDMRFCKHETTVDYLYSLKRYIKKYGKPISFYSDRHSIFRVNNKKDVLKNGITHFGKVLKDLDIDLICANSPQAKGRVERKNGVLQDRLIKEMRLKNISNMEQANEYLEEFRINHNKKFGKEPFCIEDAHKKLDKSLDLKYIFANKEKRKISKDLSFSYKGDIFQIKDRPIYSKYKGVTVIDYGSNIEVEYNGKKLKCVKWKENINMQGRIVDSKALAWINKKVRKPKKYHPWI